MNKVNKIYISGASGFIGSEISKYCKDLGYDVTGLVHKNSNKVKKELKIKTLKINLLDDSSLNLNKADAIIHCATANDIVSQKLSSGLNLSVLGTHKILLSAIKSNIKKIIYFSTAQVYGSELSGEINEKSKIKCQNFYSLNHYFGEELCKFYSQKFNLDIVIVRPSNVYGFPAISTVRRSTLVPICFIEEALKKKCINLKTSGDQFRNFISTDQISEMIVKILKDFPKGFSLLNLGSNLTIPIKSISKLVAKKFYFYKKKKITVNYNFRKPAKKNRFKYNSIYLKKNDSKDICRKKFNVVIDQFLKKN